MRNHLGSPNLPTRNQGYLGLPQKNAEVLLSSLTRRGRLLPATKEPVFNMNQSNRCPNAIDDWEIVKGTLTKRPAIAFSSEDQGDLRIKKALGASDKEP